jgi:hypothetical protein
MVETIVISFCLESLEYNFTMSKVEKIKRTILIAIGFGLATYLIMSGFAMLENSKSDLNTTSKVHTDTVK